MPAVKFGRQFAYGVVFLATLVGAISAARAQPKPAKKPTDPLALPRPVDGTGEPVVVLRVPMVNLSMSVGMSRTIQTGRPYKTIHVTTPDIIDVLALTDHTAVLIPKMPGGTNIDVFDEHGEGIASINAFVSPVSAAPAPGRVEVHNSWAHVGDSTVYICSATGCQFVLEEALKAAPPPLPAPPPAPVFIIPTLGSRQ